jgi:hypothetical protein
LAAPSDDPAASVTIEQAAQEVDATPISISLYLLFFNQSWRVIHSELSLIFLRLVQLNAQSKPMLLMPALGLLTFHV